MAPAAEITPGTIRLGAKKGLIPTFEEMNDKIDPIIVLLRIKLF